MLPGYFLLLIVKCEGERQLKEGLLNQGNALGLKIPCLSRWQMKCKKQVLGKDQINGTLKKTQSREEAEGVVVKSFVKNTDPGQCPREPFGQRTGLLRSFCPLSVFAEAHGGRACDKKVCGRGFCLIG